MLEAVANTARLRLNDAIVTIGGEIFTDTAGFSITAVNAAWRRLQESLVDYGVEALNREALYLNVVPITFTDQGIFAFINWSIYYNGFGQAAPLLPQDLIAPLSIWERPNGTIGNFTAMDRVYNGLPTVPKQALNKLWEWRQETIYFPGALSATDIRFRYAGFLADFLPSGTQSWSAQPVPINRTLNPFAWFICSEIAKARGDLDAGSFDQLAFASVDQIFNREVRQPKSVYKGAEYGKMPDQYTPTRGPAGPRGKVA